MRIYFAILTVALFALVACENSVDDTDLVEGLCVPGETQLCSCGGKMEGVVVCDRETATFEKCDCSGVVPAEETDTDTGKDPSSIAVAKMCNNLYAQDGSNYPFIVKVGYGNEQVTLQSDSLTCTPDEGQPCIEIPMGESVQISLEDETGEEFESYRADIFAGEEWIFKTKLDSLGWPKLDGGVLTVLSTLNCSEITLDNI